MPKISFVLPCFLFQHQKARQNLVVFAAFDETKKISDDKVVFCQTDTLLQHNEFVTGQGYIVKIIVASNHFIHVNVVLIWPERLARRIESP